MAFKITIIHLQCRDSIKTHLINMNVVVVATTLFACVYQ